MVFFSVTRTAYPSAEGVSRMPSTTPWSSALALAERRGERRASADPELVVPRNGIDSESRMRAEEGRAVLELDRLGVPVLSVREGWLDTSGPVRPLLVAIFSWVPEQERTRLIERTRAGLDRARRQGKVLGRPRTSSVLLHAAAELVARGQPVAAAARAKGVSRAALRRWLALGGRRERAWYRARARRRGKLAGNDRQRPAGACLLRCVADRRLASRPPGHAPVVARSVSASGSREWASRPAPPAFVREGPTRLSAHRS